MEQNNSPAEHDPAAHDVIQIQGALAMLAVAEDIDVKLTVNDVVEQLGYEASPFYRRQYKQGERWDAVVGEQENIAQHEDAEFERGRELALWLDELTPAERAGLRMRPVDYADDYCLTPMEFVTGEGDDAKPFPLGQSFNFRPLVAANEAVPIERRDNLRRPDLTLLPPDIQKFLQEKRDFWATLGVHNGGELEAFVDEYFTFTEIKLDGSALPAEVEWLFASLPGAEGILQRTGAARLRQLKGTPPAVLDHIHDVSQSQNKLGAWLKPYVNDGVEPIIYDSDYAKIEANRQKEYARLEGNAKLTDFRRELLLAREDEKAASQRDFQASLQGITNFAQIAFGIEAKIPNDLNEEDRDALLIEVGEMNDHLDAEFGNGTAFEHMHRDVIGRHSEGILKTLKLAAVLITAGEGLHLLYEHHPEWTPLAVAVFLLALMEDPISEGGEAFSQRSLGYTWREIAPRYKLIGPVAVGSVAVGLFVKGIGDNYGESAAALAFAVASCATTAATIFKTMQSAKQAYEAQVADGKVAGRVNLDQAGQAAIREALLAADDHVTAMADVRALIRQQTHEEVTDADLVDLYAAIEEALLHGDIDKAVSQVRVPFREALYAAWDETIRSNPARTGKLLGMTAMIAGGPVPPVAHLVFTQAIATMLFSMGEPATGITATYIHKFLDGPRRTRRARKEAAALRKAQAAA